MKNLNKLLQEITKCEAIIAKLRTAEDADRKRYAELDAKRGPIATAALADGNPTALQQLDEIDQEQWKIDRRLRDCGAALTNSTTELERLRIKVEQVQKSLDCDHVRDLVRSRLARGKQVETLVHQFRMDLEQQFSQMSAIDSEISAVLDRLDPSRLAQLAANTKSTPQNLTIAYVRHSLRSVLGTAAPEQSFQPGELKSMDILSKKFFVQVEGAIGALPDGPGERKGRLYQAQSRIAGLKGHTLNVGDMISLSPGDGDAEELIERGVLVPVGLVENPQNQSSTVIPQENDETAAFGVQSV